MQAKANRTKRCKQNQAEDSALDHLRRCDGRSARGNHAPDARATILQSSVFLEYCAVSNQAENLFFLLLTFSLQKRGRVEICFHQAEKQKTLPRRAFAMLSGTTASSLNGTMRACT